MKALCPTCKGPMGWLDNHPNGTPIVCLSNPSHTSFYEIPFHTTRPDPSKESEFKGVFMTGREATYRPRLAEFLEKIAAAQRLLIEVECQWASICLALGMERPFTTIEKTIEQVEATRNEVARGLGLIEVR